MANDPADRTDMRLIAADKVEGVSVYNPQGEKLGTVENIFIDKHSGQAEFATMAFGGLLGMGEKHYPLPWSVLTYDTEQDGFVVALEKDTLEGAPGYDKSRFSGADYGWREEVTGYYGATA
ncbi:PRC-barrel domain-containing protein [Phenylobacterium sp.]|uniref:PRC-barrel domain-containing protein n=1 Tax=Phenylobacterium sp. TaxID=1871053 RepID=UPI002730F443|nr:PRC-barrel domain-containing protein [Phenylobacterium sp.]MDP1874039.1 PRC-barrel domain-containing protein [Phenylobacterium sp.]MDP3489377.1 PRC-barrel domain-containing protein [Phenylobacterium sp.]